MTRRVAVHVSANKYPSLPATHHTSRIWTELAKGFDEYHVIATHASLSYHRSQEGNIFLHRLPSLSGRSFPFFFVSWLAIPLLMRIQPTHIIAQCPVLGGFAAACFARVSKIPLFLELHGDHYFDSVRPGVVGKIEHYIYRTFSRFALGSATRIRSLSDDMTFHLARVYGASVRAKAITVANRVDLDVFKAPKQTYSFKDIIRIVSVGSFVPRKNHLALIEDLALTGVQFHLSLVGSGELKGVYLAHARELGVQDRLTVFESLSHKQLADVLAQHDLYVHYSLSEGVPRAVLEAMAMGLPVVATRVGYIAGVLDHGVNALVIDKPYRPALARELRRLEGSEALRRTLGENARRTVERDFEWSTVFQRYRSAILEMSLS
jgi:glycosyltransferase involved in cell wall biosynthesis